MTQPELYPLQFDTIYKEKLWGGQKINTYLGKSFAPLPNCGETWEVSAVPGNVSTVSEGPLKGTGLDALVQTYREQLVGGKVYRHFGDEFPMLVKFLDAAQDLSIQVHPDDALAGQRHNSLGKTEMWYIIQADDDASLIAGFNKALTKEQYLQYFNNGQLEEVLNREKVQAGDVFYIPAGRVHTIGKGILLAEIQQSSDVTYRIYDFDRVDAAGNKRELHTEQAVDAIDYQLYSSYKTSYTEQPNEAAQLVKSPYFTTNKLACTNTITRQYNEIDSFVIYVCYEGTCTLTVGNHTVNLTLGNTVLLPANLNKATIKTTNGVGILETYVEL